MIRYTRQYDKYSCGPVAIGNALKWAGKIKSFKAVKPTIMEFCDTVKPWGTRHTRVHKSLKMMFSGVKCKVSPTLSDIDHWLNKGAVALRVSYKGDDGERHGHYCLLINKTRKGKYVAVNAYRGKTLATMERTDLSNLTSPKWKGQNAAMAWLIPNKNKVTND